MTFEWRDPFVLGIAFINSLELAMVRYLKYLFTATVTC